MRFLIAPLRLDRANPNKLRFGWGCLLRFLLTCTGCALVGIASSDLASRKQLVVWRGTLRSYLRGSYATGTPGSASFGLHDAGLQRRCSLYSMCVKQTRRK